MVQAQSLDKTQAIELLRDVFNQFKQGLPPQKRLVPTAGMGLLESGAELDSLEILNFLLAVEKKIKEKIGAKLVLFDLKAINQKNNPFATLDALADYLLMLLQKR